MLRAVSLDRLLADILELRLAIRQAREPTVREQLRTVERSLRATLGPSVPKKPAAAALGVSVQALDKWIDRGVLPVVARPTSSRLEVESVTLLDLLEQVKVLRAQGLERALLATAVKRLGWRDDPNGRRVLGEDVAALPRPNVSARELREQFQRTTPEERVTQAARLSAALTALALSARGEE